MGENKMNKKLDERLWYNMDYGPPMHDFFLQILEPDNPALYKMAFEIKPLKYLISMDPKALDDFIYYH